MKNFIGGLFKDRKGAELAHKALKENGFEDDAINILECTHESKAVVLNENPSIQSIGVGALIGAILLGVVGAGLGLLVGLGVLHIPGLEPSGGATVPFQITGEFIITSLTTGIIFGAITGAILGVATRLLMAKYRKVDTSRGVNQGDFMLAVQADDIRRETKARLTMKEYGAVKFEEFREKWDTDVWSVSRNDVPQTR
jgi:outer membrane lipoprotein SlyB